MLCGRLSKKKFQPDSPHIFILSTAGIAEDGWTIYINGVVDSGLMVSIDSLGFLRVVPATEISKTQRKGRAGRVADSLWCCLTEKVSEDDAHLTYIESMQVSLDARSLGLPWPPVELKNVPSSTPPFSCLRGAYQDI